MSDYREIMERARANVASGIIEEPRVLFDRLDLNNATTGQIIKGTPDTLVNGEAFPLKITHIVVSQLSAHPDEEEAIDPRTIQRVALRFQHHDQKYLSDSFVPVPLWANQVVAAADTTTYHVGSWRFAHPFILGVRDTLVVQRSGANDDPFFETPAITIHGIGLESQRPYTFESPLPKQGLASETYSPGRDLANDGSEPIVITDAVWGPGVTTDAQLADCGLNIRLKGHGTDAFWFRGPMGPAPTVTMPICPASLLCVTTGRSIVHKLEEPWIWAPADGVLLEGITTQNDVACGIVMVGLVGTTMVS